MYLASRDSGKTELFTRGDYDVISISGLDKERDFFISSSRISLSTACLG